MPETCENWLSLANSGIYSAHHTVNLPDTALLSGFQSSQGALKSTEKDSTYTQSMYR